MTHEQYLPASTPELLAFLRGLYPAEELVAMVLGGRTQEALKHALRLEFISELQEAWDEQKEAIARANADVSGA